MNIFEFRHRLVGDYSDYVKSFIHIRDKRIGQEVADKLAAGLLWPEPLIQLNPSFEPGAWIDDLVAQNVLHPECGRVFRIKPDHQGEGRPLRLHRHQEEAIRVARGGHDYVLTTGTGSGKSLAYIVPIVDHVLRQGSGRGIQAIVVYPMNALANSQDGELQKFLCHGYPDGKGPVTFRRYTGQESEEQKQEIIARPPDILLTNYVMLELILTRPREKPLIGAAHGLRFLVLDELHTYRGRQGADVALLVRRVRDATHAEKLQCVGTSATLAGAGSLEEQRSQVAMVGSQLFGVPVQQRHGFAVTRLPDFSTLDTNPYAEALADNTQTEVPDQVQFRCDHPAWVASHSDRDRRLIHAMMLGHRTKDLARRFRLSPARISQLRRQYLDDWQLFCGECSLSA